MRWKTRDRVHLFCRLELSVTAKGGISKIMLIFIGFSPRVTARKVGFSTLSLSGRTHTASEGTVALFNHLNSSNLSDFDGM